MPRPSKKDEITASAISLFLENGFKATSIDALVAVCGVSKPTIYSHFPEKAALMYAVVDAWIAKQPSPPVDDFANERELWQFYDDKLLTPEGVRLVGLAIGEGQQFPQAKKLIFRFIDQCWRTALSDFCQKHHREDAELQAKLSHRILTSLMK